MKKQALLSFCLSLLFVTAAICGDDAIAARRKFRMKLEKKGAEAVIGEAMRSSDSAIRKYALARLYDAAPEKALPFAEKALDDESADVRALAASLMGPHLNDNRTAKLNTMAESDKDQMVRRAASAALWPLHRDNVLLKNDKSWDHLVKMVGSFDLPEKGWRISDDVASNGHWRGFGSAAFDDSAWTAVDAGEKLFAQKKGVQWLRVHFTPVAPKSFNAFEIVLPEVKGKCFVWLNGIYLGQRMDEKTGEFRLNATSELIPGKDNVLSIRIDATEAGGLLKLARGEWME